MDTLSVFTAFHNQVPERQLVYESVQFEEDVHSSPENILTAIKESRPKPQDCLFVYFTGHGGSDDRGHYLQLAQGKLYRDDIRKAMESKGCKLNVLITDCCNTRGDGESFFFPAPMLEPPQRISPLFESLFFASKGWVDINSSAPGEAAFFTANYEETGELPGSLFTKRLSQFWDEQRKRGANWDQLVRWVSIGVMADFHSQYPNGASVAKGQPAQQEQNVFAIDYPGMPTNQGPRTGLMVRDAPGGGALISSVATGSPASLVYNLTMQRTHALTPKSTITFCNGEAVQNAAQFVQLAQQSPQIMRLRIRQQNAEFEALMRLRY